MENKEKRSIAISLTVLLFIGYEAVSLLYLYYAIVVGHWFFYMGFNWQIDTIFQNLFTIAIIITLLFERKKNRALFIAVLIDSIYKVIYEAGTLILYGEWSGDILYTEIIQIFSLLSYTALAILTLTMWFGKEKIKKDVSAMWFLPGGLRIVVFICRGIGYGYFQAGGQYIISNVFYILALFALGWRLSHVYIKSDVSAVPVSRQEKVPSETVREFAFCPACGKKHMRTALFCPECGRQLREADSQPVVRQVQEVGGAERQSEGVPLQNMQDIPSGGYNALGFLIPVAGLVLYLVWREQTPLRAKAIGKSALAGAAAYTVLSIIINLIPVLFIRSYF